MIEFKKKNLIALALVGVLALTGLGAYKAQAAGRIDVDATVTITANVDPNSKFAQDYETYNGKDAIVIKLYKIASLDAAGQPTATDDFKNKINLDVLSGSKVAVKDIEDGIVTPALEAVSEGAAAIPETITVPMTGEGKYTGSVKIAKGAGIYLYVPQDDNEAVKDDRYTYTFTPYIIMAPSSEYITATNADGEAVATGSDQWNDKVSFNLKAEGKQRYGLLRIDKDLKKINESLKTASFVYRVDAELDGKNVFSNVYSLDFNYIDDDNFIWVAGPDGEGILPATAKITVTEVYTGASYTLKASSYSYLETYENVAAENAKISADKTLIANFSNDYDDELQVGGISVVNRFEKSEDGSYKYAGNNLAEEEAVNNEE